GPAAPAGAADLDEQFGVPERPCRAGDALHLARHHVRAQGRARHHAPEPPDLRGHRDHGARRADPHLSAGPLDERRVLGLGARALVLHGRRRRGAGHWPHPRQSPALMTGPFDSIVAPVLALGTEYWLFGAAGVLSVCAFVALILVPALGSYGRPWEKL